MFFIASKVGWFVGSPTTLLILLALVALWFARRAAAVSRSA